MRKKYILKLVFLTPLVALLLATSAFFVYDYPQSIAGLNNLIANNKTSIPSSNTNIDLEALENRIKDRILKDFNLAGPMSLDIARDVLACTVQITKESSSGTGVVIYENKIDDIYYSYIITNQHVVTDAQRVEVIRFNYLRNAAVSSRTSYIGKVIRSNEDLDLALIELQTAESVGPTAEFDSSELDSNLTLYQKVYVAGCPLGNPPLITNGNVAFISDTRNVITAFSIFGSSGGGVFTKEGKLVSLVRGVAVLQMSGNVRIPQSNLTQVIPGPLMRSWLLVENLSFVLRDGTHEDFIKARKKEQTRPAIRVEVEVLPEVPETPKAAETPKLEKK